MVVRGISITQDESSKGMAVLYFMCVQAGEFTLALNLHACCQQSVADHVAVSH